MKLSVTDTLQKYLEAHSIKVEVKEQTLVAGNMVLSARVFEKPSSRIRNLLQLDINVNSPKFPGRTLIESFAGWGESEQEAINSAWEKLLNRHCTCFSMYLPAKETMSRQNGSGGATTMKHGRFVWARFSGSPLAIRNLRI